MSKKLDDELAAAAEEAEEIDAKDEEAPSSTPGLSRSAQSAAGPARQGSRNLGILAALLTMVVAVVALFLIGFKEAAVYATPVDKLMSDKSALVGRKVRVEGELVPGTLVKRDQPCEYRFSVHGQDKNVVLPVRYPQCVIPDTFRDVPGGGVQVTIEGAMTAQGDFEASLVMAKCASKYDPKTHQMQESPSAEGLPVN